MNLPGRPPSGAPTSPALAAALDLLGHRGTLRLLWELRDGQPQSFRLLRDSADGISPSVLNTRLGELREARVVEDTGSGYALTPSGRDLVQRLKPLNHWADLWAAESGKKN